MPVSNFDILTAQLQLPVQVLLLDGAITALTGFPVSVVAITKGSIIAGTIADPTTVVDDGKLVWVYTETAFAHVVTAATSGFNGKGSSGTLTWAAAKGNAVLLHARGGKWWVLFQNGVTVA